jgi:hypothetical protein
MEDEYYEHMGLKQHVEALEKASMILMKLKRDDYEKRAKWFANKAIALLSLERMQQSLEAL